MNFDRSTLLRENVVSYEIHLFKQIGGDDSSSQGSEPVKMLERMRNDCCSWSKDWMWHKEAFSLSLFPAAPLLAKDKPLIIQGRDQKYEYISCFSGETVFGDCIEDEWFIVHLLHRLSMKYNNVVISTRDNDGEFLLIEAALHLPKWLDSAKEDVTDNRVFIFQGNLHIIPLYPSTPAELSFFTVSTAITNNHNPSPTLSLHSALRMILNSRCKTEAHLDIQTAAFERITKYPLHISDNRHRARTLIPIKLALIIRKNPRLVSFAVDAFYNREPMTQKACRSMLNFPPDPSVSAVVEFTKTMYAQLHGQHFYPPKLFGTAPVPEGSKEWKEWDIGMKLTCGFEMLLANPDYSSFGTFQDFRIETFDFESDGKWLQFKNRLNRFGIKKDEVEMKRSYLDTLKQQSSPIISSSQIALGVSEIHTLLAQSDSELRENDRGDGEDHQVTDSDSWLEISPLSLDSKLEKLQHEWHMGEDEGDFGLNEQSEDESDNDNDLENVSKAAAAPPSSSAGYRKLNNLVSKVESFLGHSSSVEGVEFPELDDCGDDELGVQLDETEFMKRIMQLLGETEGKDPAAREEEEEEEGVTTASLTDVDTEESLDSLMECMDRELYSSKMGQSFEKVRLAPGSEELKDFDHGDYDDDEYRQVDIDVNLVKNMLESMSTAEGLSNPAETILRQLNLY